MTTDVRVPIVTERSPSDVLRAVVAAIALIVTLLVEWLFGDELIEFGSDLLAGLRAVPQWLVDVVLVGTRVLGWIVFVGGLVLAVWRRWFRLIATAAVAAVVAVLLTALLIEVNDPADGADLVDSGIDMTLGDAGALPTIGGLAAAAAVLTAAAPWLGRGWRRAGWLLIVGWMTVTFVDAPLSFDPIVAILSGWLAGAAVLALLGAPSRRPTIDAVIEGLARVGVPVQDLHKAGVDARGSTPYFGRAGDGASLFVKVLGEDERSADLLFRFYRRLQRRNFGDEKPFSTLRRGVEHEALVAFAARDMGVKTPRVRAFATADPNGYVLAYEGIDGRSLDRVEAGEVSDDVLAAIWRLVGELRRRGIAHRDLRLANVFLDDAGAVWLIDFGFAEMAASDLLLATDVAELVASSSLVVGPERAVAQAVAAVDPTTLARAVDRLRPWALSGATRTGLKSRPGLLDELRRRLAATAGPGQAARS